MCISRSFGDLITARTLIPTEFLSMHFVLRQKPMKNHLFSVLSGDECVMWSDEEADTRKRRKVIGFSSIVHINVLADYDIYK